MVYSRTTKSGVIISEKLFTEEELAECRRFGIDAHAEARWAVDQEVERQNKENTMQAIIYTKSPCPFCDRAKMLFNHKGIEYTEVNAVENKDDMIQRVTEATGEAPRTVPQIWVGDEYVGGFTQLVEYFKNQG